MKKLYEAAKKLMKDKRGFWPALALFAASAALTGYQQHQANKEQRKQQKILEEEMANNKVLPTVSEGEAADELRRRKGQKQGRASTVLAGDYRQSAAKRLLGE